MSCIHPNRLLLCGKKLYMTEATVLQESVEMTASEEKRRSWRDKKRC